MAGGCTELLLSINKSSRRIARGHVGACNGDTSIGAFIEEQVTSMSYHSNPKKITQKTKILHRKFRGKEYHDRFAKVVG